MGLVHLASCFLANKALQRGSLGVFNLSTLADATPLLLFPSL